MVHKFLERGKIILLIALLLPMLSFFSVQTTVGYSVNDPSMQTNSYTIDNGGNYQFSNLTVEGNLVISATDPIHIYNSNITVINGSIQIHADDVLFENSTIEQIGSSSSGNFVEITNAILSVPTVNNVTLTGNKIISNDFTGILVKSATSSIMSGIIFQNNTVDGALSLEYTRDIVFSHNTIYGNFWIYQVTNITMNNNNLFFPAGSADGVVTTYVQHMSVTNNTVDGKMTGYGPVLFNFGSTYNLTVSDNYMTLTEGRGVVLFKTNDTFISNNYIEVGGVRPVLSTLIGIDFANLSVVGNQLLGDEEVVYIEAENYNFSHNFISNHGKSSESVAYILGKDAVVHDNVFETYYSSEPVVTSSANNPSENITLYDNQYLDRDGIPPVLDTINNKTAYHDVVSDISISFTELNPAVATFWVNGSFDQNITEFSTSSFNYELPTNFDVGIYNVTVELRDAAGNINTATFWLSISIDESAPVITPIADQQTTYLGQNIHVDISITDEAGYEFWIYRNGSELGPYGERVIGYRMDSAFYPGIYNITILAKDSSNNTATETFYITILPESTTPQISTPQVDFNTQSSSVDISFTVSDIQDDRGDIEVYVNGSLDTSVGGFFMTSMDITIILSASDLTTGSYNITVLVTDISGNTNRLQFNLELTQEDIDRLLGESSISTTSSSISNEEETKTQNTSGESSPAVDIRFLWIPFLVGVVGLVLIRRYPQR